MTKRKFKASVLLNPVPAVLVTCKNSEGKENVFTVAWTGTICSKPPMLYISIRPERLSYDYIKETKEFIINLPSSNQTKATDYCGVRSGRTNDKIKEMNFTMIKGENVNCSYIEECPINIECRVKNIVELGSHDMFIAEVIATHIDESLIDEKDKIHFENANLITYSHGEYYPLPKNSIGKFGFSVAKKIIKKKKVKK
ncbi:flavin reductase family protein [Fusobacterium russii]|uniref:flavin reductase family protein n=1 Tax=Fusobacterium russii TaxID=854 RepID=UPI00039DC7D1|nr:flavin reductase family protein [Fusobacterium russii]